VRSVGGLLSALSAAPGTAFWLALGAVCFAVSFVLFLRMPSIAVALVIPLFALLPTFKELISPSLGPGKDIVIAAAAVASALVCRADRRWPDAWVLALVGAVLALYAINISGQHDIAWAHGVRLTGEPLVLLIVGLTLRDSRRTLRYAVVSLVASACFLSAYGVVQQIAGPRRLVAWGYSWDHEVRVIDGHLRSFGTFDDSFVYAAFLLLALSAVMFSLPRDRFAYASTVLILIGLATSLVRSALFAGAAVCAVWLVSRGYRRPAVASLAIALVGTAAVVAAQGGSNHRPVGVKAVLTLNDRVPHWKDRIGNPSKWPLGRGVGETGTAATRAAGDLRTPTSAASSADAVDSAYLATVADVGLVGLALLLGLFGRLVYLARRLLPSMPAWLGLAWLTVLLVDALSRSSLTGFPTAFLALLLVGLALAAAEQERKGPVNGER
jgi:hypothetical protein